MCLGLAYACVYVRMCICKKMADQKSTLSMSDNLCVILEMHQPAGGLRDNLFHDSARCNLHVRIVDICVSECYYICVDIEI